MTTRFDEITITAFEIMINRLESTSEFLYEHEQIGEQEAVDKAIEILQTLERWCDAYPEHIFTPVNWPDYHRALEHAGLSGTAAAADCMRHVTNGFKKVLHDD